MANRTPSKPTERCVAVLDVLGFQSFIADGKIEDLARQLDVLYQHASSATQHWAYASSGTNAPTYRGKETINRLLFSDSLFLWSQPLPTTPIRRRARVIGFASIVTNILGSALARGLPMRAGLAFGEVIIDLRKQIIIGQPIVDAYHVESMQDWAGGAFHASYPREPISHAFDYEIPVKDSMVEPPDRALDWVTQFYAGTRREANDIIGQVRSFLEEQIASAISTAVLKKYVNTLEFLNNRHAICESGFLQ